MERGDMSIKTKMTAIADKLRALAGSTAPLTLDGMASALDVQQTQVANAFTAVADMEGTVPVTQRLSTLPDAIRTIPTGTQVQTKTGTFRFNSSASATVNCGFKPDFVVISGGTSGQGGNGGSGYTYHAGVDFTCATKSSRMASVAEGTSNNYDLLYFLFTQNSNGFSAMGKYYEYDWSGGSISTSKNWSYIAVKYTA